MKQEIKGLEMRLEERVSQKGNKYTVLVIQLTPTVEKMVFLNNAEIELLKLKNGK